MYEISDEESKNNAQDNKESKNHEEGNKNVKAVESTTKTTTTTTPKWNLFGLDYYKRRSTLSNIRFLAFSFSLFLKLFQMISKYSLYFFQALQDNVCI